MVKSCEQVQLLGKAQGLLTRDKETKLCLVHYMCII